ncbi:uncharacterized protein LOC123392858 [Mustela putorius furo]|uniref:Uncharacterized protein LOC123392858 n=1 Tax=Mustela putorius furo TaxID=9669 RepID=A0A8U0V4X2_MUSPF|nr:uncharacterized protein LOC123392858 [Mustela putorius furo]
MSWMDYFPEFQCDPLRLLGPVLCRYSVKNFHKFSQIFCFPVVHCFPAASGRHAERKSLSDLHSFCTRSFQTLPSVSFSGLGAEAGGVRLHLLGNRTRSRAGMGPTWKPDQVQGPTGSSLETRAAPVSGDQEKTPWHTRLAPGPTESWDTAEASPRTFGFLPDWDLQVHVCPQLKRPISDPKILWEGNSDYTPSAARVLMIVAALGGIL